MRRFYISIIMLFLAIPACQTSQSGILSESPQTTQIVPSTTASLEITSTEEDPTPVDSTFTPIPSLSLTPSLTEMSLSTTIPTIQLPPIPTGKEILISHWIFGDTGQPTPQDYFGILLPKFILYTDGQLIWHEYEKGLLETTLSIEEMCTLMTDLKNTGIFTIEGDGFGEWFDPIYVDIPEASWGWGDYGLSHLILINGYPSKKMLIENSYQEYLIPEVREMFDIFLNFQPKNLEPYRSDRYLLYIKKGEELVDLYGDSKAKAVLWSKALPKLKDLMGKKDELEMELTKEQVELLLPLFTKVPSPVLFEQNETKYSIILRPLLPFETTGNLSALNDELVEFSLPFTCKQ
jgi:hypothetical protein